MRGFLSEQSKSASEQIERCQYGNRCRMRDPIHRALFSHPRELFERVRASVIDTAASTTSRAMTKYSTETRIITCNKEKRLVAFSYSRQVVTYSCRVSADSSHVFPLPLVRVHEVDDTNWNEEKYSDVTIEMNEPISPLVDSIPPTFELRRTPTLNREGTFPTFPDEWTGIAVEIMEDAVQTLGKTSMLTTSSSISSPPSSSTLPHTPASPVPKTEKSTETKETKEDYAGGSAKKKQRKNRKRKKGQK